jgi:hypothetical protein
MCADHNLRNRGGLLLATTDIDLLNRYCQPVTIEPQTKKTVPQVGDRVELIEEYGFWPVGTIGIVVGFETRDDRVFYWVDQELNRYNRLLIPERVLKTVPRLPTIKEAFDQERVKLLRGKSLLEHFTGEIAFGIGEDKPAKEIATNLISTIDQWLPSYLKVDK